MPLNIRSEDVNRLANTLAEATGVSKTEAVRTALTNEIERQKRSVPLTDRLKPLLDRLDAMPSSGLKADKPFYDSLSDE